MATNDDFLSPDDKRTLVDIAGGDGLPAFAMPPDRTRKRTKLKGARATRTVTFERTIIDLAERLALGDWNCAEAEAFRRLAKRGAATASDPKVDKEIRLRALLDGISEEEVVLQLILAGARATKRG